MPTYRITRTEVTYIEAKDEDEAHEVHGDAFENGEAGMGAGSDRMAGVVVCDPVTDHAPDFRALHEPNGPRYEATETCGA